MPEETIPIPEVAADSVATVALGTMLSHKEGGSIEVVEVVVEQTNNADAEFNLQVGGNDAFSNEQSVAAADTLESFTPDQNEFASDNVLLEIDVSNAAANAGDVLNGGVRVRY
jgi:hypothetical protein